MLAMCVDGGWSILKIVSPLRMSSSFILSLVICVLVLAMNSVASWMLTSSENGPLLLKSSSKMDTVFLNSSAECNKPDLNFS